MKKDKGFTLLIAIVTTSILLVVSFSIVNIALKQLLISQSNKQSQYAFYNSDSGTECAVYWDLRNTNVPGVSAFDISNNPVPPNIDCGGNSIPVTIVAGVAPVISSATFTLNLTRGCAIVTVTKKSIPAPVTTTIDSKGYNDCSAGFIKKFERAITLTYN